MTLSAGTRIGPYEVQAPLGAGGMGEVYRARDMKLARDVALKILPDDVVHDAARVARFQREAQLLAALNHPHIAQIYGFEDSTEIHALVMELVDGPTLADIIAAGGAGPFGPAGTPAKAAGLPLDEALPIARQIAEALEAAHEQGIVHRDLKPANIKVRPDGTVKVLDFGLAKLREGVGRDFSPAGSKDPAYTHSPTITSPAMMTGVGVILGTAAYMAPEQARGKDVDKRADIWAFGCVLYEMLAARRLFAADEVSDTLALVLTKEVDWTPLPTTTPPAIRTLLRRCLERDPRRRLPHIGVARLEVDEALTMPAPQVPLAANRVASRRLRLAWGVAALATGAALVFAGMHFSGAPSDPQPPIRFSVLPPSGMTAPVAGGAGQWLSPDGRHVVFRVIPVGGTIPGVKLALRSFDQLEARILAGTEGAAEAFWSPDSRSIAFFAAGKLLKIDPNGGPPQVICDAPFTGTGGSTGGSWSADGTIVFGVGGNSGLFRVSAGGGTPVPVTQPDATRNESVHRHPWFLPDRRHFLYVATSGRPSETNSVFVGSLDGEPPRALVQNATKAIYADGFVFFVRDDVLLAQPFDPASLGGTGDPVVVAQDIATAPVNANSAISVSAVGILSYRTNPSETVSSQLAWFDRSGRMLATVGEPIDQAEIQLSPDGTRVAVSVLDATARSRDLWLYDLTRGGLRTRFTFDSGDDWSSAWSPDGRSLAFSGSRPTGLDIHQKNADGSGAENRWIESPGNQYVNDWSADGRYVLYHNGTAGSQTGSDLWMLPLAGERKPSLILQTPFNEARARLSPDGRWVAYESNESGRLEIYIMRFPGGAGKWQVSTAGGEGARWRRDGRELFYVVEDTIMAAEVNGTGAAFQVGSVRPLLKVRRRTTSYTGLGIGDVYDVSPDGQRFLVNVMPDGEEPPQVITVVTNWKATL